MEDFTIPPDSTKNGNISVIEEEKDKVKDFVYKHFREVTDGPLFSNAEDSPIKETRTFTKKDKQTLKAHCKVQQRAVFSGKILSFGCSVCKDNFTFSPNDLLKHFRVAHQGSLPTYPCDLCDFVTNEFPALQRHRIEHRNTLVPCELCNNNIQYSLLLLTRHYIMCHSVNGQFRCDWCEFTTVDAGTFVQHIHHHNESHWKCSKCRHISLNEEDHQVHMKAHSGTFPFTCQVCGFGAAKCESLKKHSATVHKEEAERRNPWKAIEDAAAAVSPSGNFKISFTKSCDSQETQRTSRPNHLSGTAPSQNGRLLKPDVAVEEASYILDGSVGKKDGRGSSKASQNADQSTSVMLQECDNSLSPSPGGHTNGLTVLMVKNKISLPPHCTTKVMGFKMVDGKKHLVLKVIPAVKQNPSTQNHSTANGAGPLVLNPVMDKSKASVENRQCSVSQCLAVLPTTGSCIQMDQDDIMAVKVKIEEEETSVCNFNSPPHTGDDSEQSNLLLNPPLISVEPVRNQLDHVGDQSHSGETIEGSQKDNLDSETCKSDAASHSTSDMSSSTTVCKTTSLSSTSSVVETDESNSVPTKDVCEKSEESLTDGEILTEKDQGVGGVSSMNIIPTVQVTSEETGVVSMNVSDRDVQPNVNDVKPHTQPSQSSSGCSRESPFSTGNIPNQEVFNFHNYSKETFRTLPNTSQTSDCNSEHSEDEKNSGESSEFSLTLAESPEHLTESPECDVVVDDYIAGMDDTSIEENVDSVLQDFNIIKIEEDSVPISTKQSETSGSSAQGESLVEAQSDELIKQLNKERTESVGISDSSKQTKTTLRILQLPSKQPVLLSAAQNRFAVPLQVKATPGFKLLTKSASPQIKVSTMKPGLGRPGSGPTLAPKTQVTGVPTAKPQLLEKSKTLFSAFKPAINSSSNHYLINSSGLKGPVLLSPQAAPAEKTVKTPQMCYLVQRSVPLNQTQTPPALKLASASFPLTSRPVLAMPVVSAEKASTLQTGCQAFLLRYVSPQKSGLFLNNQVTKSGAICNQSSESSGKRVILKIVTPTGSVLTSGAPTSNSQPLLLASRPQTKCFLVSSNKNNATASSGVKKTHSIQNTVQSDMKSLNAPPSQMNIKLQACEAEKPSLAPRPVRPPSQRKRRMKALFGELPTAAQKVRRLSNKVQTERETSAMWRPVAKEVERTLRLAPFSLEQQVKCPRRYQPVVVLNHPDADVPEVANIMKVVNRYKGAITKVALCQQTVQALSDLPAKAAWCGSDASRLVQSSVQERFLLKLKLRKKSKKKYEVVKTLSGSSPGSAVFECWFCGRLFNNQEDWVGHGQKHLMEATRDWNNLF